MTASSGKKAASVLIVDDDQKTRDAISLILSEGYSILTASHGQGALEIIAKKKVDVVFLDIHMPGGMDGLEVLKRIKDSGENISVVMVTATNTAKMAVEAMKHGAYDYLTKPFDPEEILVVTKKALENHQLMKEVIYFRSQVKPTLSDNLIGTSDALRKVCERVLKVASTDVTVLVEGESGTGKELIARAIHFLSPRREKPFLALNCAGIPANLLEAELFGYERGAFTGADKQKFGKFELAHEGTFFLDEVSSLPLEMQGKILRVLQEKEIERVGGVKTIKIDVRVVSATNVDLAAAVKAGKFREDLYYRLKVVPIHLPPLRERKEDIPLLLAHFLRRDNQKFNKNILGISKEALRYLTEYHWPGNIRELENLMERLVVLSEKDVIDTPDLPFDVFLRSQYRMEAMMEQSLILKNARDIFEHDYIQAVLNRTGGNQTQAAKLLGVHRNTLLLKLQELGLKEE